MKQVLIIGSRTSGVKNNPRTIAESFGISEIVEPHLAYWEDLVFHIATGSVDILVNEVSLFDIHYDVVIATGWYKNGKKSYYRDVAYAAALIMEQRGVRFWNSEMGQQRSTTKLSTMVQLALNNIPVPTTYFSIDFTNVENSIPRPFVAKAIAASRGKSNFLVTNIETLAEARAEGLPMLIQEYLENTHDLRVICFGGTPTLILRRARAEGAATHLNNTSQGGSAEWIKADQVDPGILTISQKISTITKRELAGIDFIPDVTSPIRYSCLEVNAIPQLTSGTDVNKKLTSFIKAIEALS